MADSLSLIGIKRISKHTGDDLALVTPTKGGDHHKIRRWWSDNENNAPYVNCTKFNVTRTDGDVVLLIPSTQDTRLHITFDGDSVWGFAYDRGVSRVGVFTTNYQLIEEYVLPSISGGQVMKRTPAGAAAYPS